MLARCTSTVFTLIDRSDAICFALAVHHAAQHFLLARGQRIEPLAQLAVTLAHRMPLLREPQRALHALEHLLRVVRLLDEIDRAVLQRAHGHRDIAVPADEDHRQRRAARVGSACTSKPLFSGIRTSSRARREVHVEAREKSVAFANPSDAMPTDSSSHASDVRMPLSSSTMRPIGAGDVIASVSLNIGIGIARVAYGAGSGSSRASFAGVCGTS